MHDDKSEGLFGATDFNLPRGASRFNRPDVSPYIAWLPNPPARACTLLSRRIAGAACTATEKTLAQRILVRPPYLLIQEENQFSSRRDGPDSAIADAIVRPGETHARVRQIRPRYKKRQPVPVRARRASEFQMGFHSDRNKNDRVKSERSFDTASYLFSRARVRASELNKKQKRKKNKTTDFILWSISFREDWFAQRMAPNTMTQRRRNTANLTSALTPLTFVKNNSRRSIIKRERIPRPSTMREELIHDPYETNRAFIAIAINIVKTANCLIIIPQEILFAFDYLFV